MKPVTLNELPSESKVFTDGWTLMKNTFMARTDEDWRKAVVEAQGVIAKWEGTPCAKFAMDMCQIVLEHVERMSHE